MPEGWGLDVLNNVGVVSGCLLLVYLFVKDHLVSGRRLREAVAERDRWQAIALEAMRVSATAIVPAAESVHALVSHLPDPGRNIEAGDSP